MAVLFSRCEKEMDCSKEVVIWNYFDHEHVVGTNYKYYNKFNIVAEKDPGTYSRVLERHRLDPAAFVMVGNSLKSDCKPVLSLGGHAAFVPHPLTWALEHPDDEVEIRASPRFREVASLEELPALLEELA